MREKPLPRGNDLLVSLAWQAVPATPKVKIFPVIRKPDLISSNSYLLCTGDCLVLIDSGGLADQGDTLLSEIVKVRKTRKIPLLVILTHAHIDHFAALGFSPGLLDRKFSTLIVQESGARALENCDTEMTQASVLGRTFPKITAGLNLFLPVQETDLRALFANREIPLSPQNILACTRFPAGPEGFGLDREILSSGGSEPLEVFHTPGHSPDSVSIRIGRLLFIGDVLFAANPGVAGLRGWNRDDLIRSLDCLLALLKSGRIDLVCPGHGRVITADTACAMLAASRADAVALDGIAELNTARAQETAAFAEDCMEELNELFTVMAGRLFYVSHVLEELGETDMATQADKLIDGDALDGLLDGFKEFADAHHAKNHVSIHLALKAGQVIGRLEQSLKKDDLSRIIDVSLVNRAIRLLASYTATLRGFSLPKERVPSDLCTVVESVVIGLSGPSCSDEDILAATDDGEAFSRMLVARLGNRPLLDDVNVSIRRGTVEPDVVIDRDIFSDLVTYIIEDLVGTGADRIEIGITTDEKHATVAITGTGRKLSRDRQEMVRGFFTRLCNQAGGILVGSPVSDGHRYEVTVYRVI
ncbi:MAG: MBL fold metallo-hydrolase [Methanoregula sp.]|jgi:glyoxylase-like metal-dependent hydrolase (beta-lactamase superfamily II)